MKYNLRYKLLLIFLLLFAAIKICLAEERVLLNEMVNLENYYKYPVRIGFYAIDLETGKTIGYREKESFIMTSTVKLPVTNESNRCRQGSR